MRTPRIGERVSSRTCASYTYTCVQGEEGGREGGGGEGGGEGGGDGNFPWHSCVHRWHGRGPQSPVLGKPRCVHTGVLVMDVCARTQRERERREGREGGTHKGG